MLELNNIYHGNCIELMKDIPSGSINLILTDVPYNISKNARNINSYHNNGEPLMLEYGEWDKDIIHWWQYIHEFSRLLADNGVLILWHDIKELGIISKVLTKKHGMRYKTIGSWIKTNSPSRVVVDNWRQAMEYFLIMTKNQGMQHHFNKDLKQTFNYYIRHTGRTDSFHTTEKPLELIKWQMIYWSQEDDVVLDPFSGSGTTCVAARDLKRNYIGIELDDVYYKKSLERLNSKELLL